MTNPSVGTLMVEDQNPDEDTVLNDEELRARTDDLVATALSVSMELRLQTEKLNAAIQDYDRDVIAPLREGRMP